MNAKKKKIIILSSFLVIVVCAILFYFLYIKDLNIKKQMNLIFELESQEIEYGSETNSELFVKEGHEYVKTYPKVDTKKIGKQALIYILEKESVEKKVSYTIEIVDTKLPIITFSTDRVELVKDSEYNIEDYIKEVKDPIDGNLTIYKSGDKKSTYSIESDVDVSTVGEYEVRVIAMDINGNEAVGSLAVFVNEQVMNPVPTDPTQVKPTYINGILLVNKKYGIPPSFGGVNESANNALYQLQRGANNAGFDMPLVSGYRSYEYQVGLYNTYVERDGQEAADRYSARPGHSEHQTGLCFDIGAIDNNYGETAAGKWLAAHAHEYGFIIRFPKGQEHITGYMYEPWHVRFVGEQIASDIYQQGVTLEEYLNVY